MGFCSRWKFPTQGMTVLSGTGHPEGWKLPSRTEHHIRFFFLHNNPKNLVYFKVLRIFFRLGENTWLRCNFITQAKSVAISVWCARTDATCQVSLKSVYQFRRRRFYFIYGHGSILGYVTWIIYVHICSPFM